MDTSLSFLSFAFLIVAGLYKAITYLLGVEPVSKEPQFIPQTIPFIGHLLGIVRYGTTYYSQVMYYTSKPVPSMNLFLIFVAQNTLSQRTALECLEAGYLLSIRRIWSLLSNVTPKCLTLYRSSSSLLREFLVWVRKPKKLGSTMPAEKKEIGGFTWMEWKNRNKAMASEKVDLDNLNALTLRNMVNLWIRLIREVQKSICFWWDGFDMSLQSPPPIHFTKRRIRSRIERKHF